MLLRRVLQFVSAFNEAAADVHSQRREVPSRIQRVYPSVGGSATKEMLMKCAPTPAILRRKRRRTTHSASSSMVCRRHIEMCRY